MSRFHDLEITEYPRVVSLVTCDRIITDAATGKRSLIDLCDGVAFPQLPARLLRLGIYMMILHGTEDVRRMSVGLFTPGGDAVLGGTIEIEDWRNGQAEIELVFPSVLFSEPGVYDLRVFVADRVLGRRPLVVQMLPPPPAEEAGSPTP